MLSERMTEERWTTERLLEQLRETPERYREFLRVPTMSAGVYRLDAGAIDSQTPHGEDEIYVVLRGRGRFRSGSRDGAVSAGTVLFVPARQEHRFHSIEEALDLLVVFAPAEQSAP